MILRDILNRKGTRVVSVKTGATVYDAVSTMVENKVGAVLVVDDSNTPLGIFTERDNMKLSIRENLNLKELTVDDFMTSENLVVGLPGDSVEEAMKVMTDKRVRHLPVVSDGLLVGLVSIGDVVKAVTDKFVAEIHYLKNYIAQVY